MSPTQAVMCHWYCRRCFSMRIRLSEFPDQVAKLGPLRAEFGTQPGFVVLEFETRADRTSQQSPVAAGRKVRALPDAAWRQHLRSFALVQTIADSYDFAAAAGVEL